jgi:hypothetical protein
MIWEGEKALFGFRPELEEAPVVVVEGLRIGSCHCCIVIVLRERERERDEGEEKDSGTKKVTELLMLYEF